MSGSLLLNLAALLALIPASLAAFRRRVEHRDALFWVLLAVALAGSFAVFLGRSTQLPDRPTAPPPQTNAAATKQANREPQVPGAHGSRPIPKQLASIRARSCRVVGIGAPVIGASLKTLTKGANTDNATG